MSLFHPNTPFKPANSRIFYGWTILAASTFGIIMSMPGQTAGVGPFTEKLLEVVPLNRTQLTLAYMLGTVAGGLILPSVGKLYDRVGVRKLVVVVAFAFGLSLIGMSQCDRLINSIIGPIPETGMTPWGYGVAFGVMVFGYFSIRFLGQGCLTMISRSMLNKWFNYRRGLASAISGIAVAMFFSLAPYILKVLIDGVSIKSIRIEGVGWRNTWLVLGIVEATLVVFIGWLLYRDNPEECGLTMDGDYQPKSHKKPMDELVILHEFKRGEALKTIPFWIVTFSLSFQAMTFTALLFHMDYIGRINGLGKNIYMILPPMAAVGTLVNLGLGSISDRIRLKHIIRLLLFGMTAYPILVMSLESTLGWWVCITLMGLVNGCWSLVMTLAWPRYFGRKNMGAINGVCMSLTVIMSAIGPYLYSQFMDISGSILPAMLISSAGPLFLLIASVVIVNPQLRYTEADE